jgi:uncharacterized membrane protein YbhN (UPF0104 family)
VIASPFVWGGLLLVVLLIGLFRKQFRHRAFYRKGQELLQKVWEGIQSIRTLRHPCLFIFYSVLLWAIYVLMFYVGRFFFPDNIPLGLLPMLGAFIMGSIGVSVPVQAGIGTYHAMVIYALTFYGLDRGTAATFALVIHGLQTIQSALFGLIAWRCLSYNKAKKATV